MTTGTPSHPAGQAPVTAAQAGPFYLAEDHHQQYLAKNPDGYDRASRTGVACVLR